MEGILHRIEISEPEGWHRGPWPAHTPTMTGYWCHRPPRWRDAVVSADDYEAGLANGVAIFPAWPASFPPATLARQRAYLAHEIFSEERFASWTNWACCVLSLVAVVLAVVVNCVSSMPEYRDPWSPPASVAALRAIEIACMALFSLEYAARLLTCVFVPDAEECERARLSGVPLCLACRPAVAARRLWWFCIGLLNVLDVASFAPLYVWLLSGGAAPLLSFAVLRVGRLSRVLTLHWRTRGAPHAHARARAHLQLLSDTMSNSVDVLGFLLFFLACVVVVMATAMYWAERGTWNDNGPYGPGFYRLAVSSFGSELGLTPFYSIPASLWYVVVTLSTVGYGDIVPTSSLGKSIGTLIILLGVVTLSLPLGVISANFSAAYTVHKEEMARLAETERHLTRTMAVALPETTPKAQLSHAAILEGGASPSPCPFPSAAAAAAAAAAVTITATATPAASLHVELLALLARHSRELAVLQATIAAAAMGEQKADGAEPVPVRRCSETGLRADGGGDGGRSQGSDPTGNFSGSSSSSTMADLDDV